MEMTTDKEFA